jgi:hypothetical protein
MRLTIPKHHQPMLRALAAQLNSDDPADALAHILNCWVVLPPSTAPQPAAIPSPPKTADPLDGIAEF